jgi:hypothetical protein
MYRIGTRDSIYACLGRILVPGGCFGKLLTHNLQFEATWNWTEESILVGRAKTMAGSNWESKSGETRGCTLDRVPQIINSDRTDHALSSMFLMYFQPIRCFVVTN